MSSAARRSRRQVRTGGRPYIQPKGLVARTDENTPRYSTSFYKLLGEMEGDYTASEIDSLCESTGMSKRQVYYHIFTD
ncbi:uncharacterized protein OE_6281R (plasmid) [Halobacterium salinarum R1]|uniref:Uncharacterized protein n=1 Tax=Halobacterium salinarum (strain ATCC 29341 / DSM 671 / R1) TaxID=478009 RepID=B0R981_HALS3|nr:uncharacterized protein OE_6281R [Halobacterium salinarum R1]